MKLNADFSKGAAVHFRDAGWVASPAAGVERRMLDRIGDEVARATTIVRFAPGSAFAAHTHDGGEEYLVLEGVFQDETGDFPVGSYVRNPPTSRHRPSAKDGAVILVKLHQFDPADRAQVHLDTAGRDEAVLPLFSDAHETVRIETWPAGTEVAPEAEGGLEVFVLEGGFVEGGENFAEWDWLRLPPGAAPRIRTGPEGARVWAKSGHLANLA